MQKSLIKYTVGGGGRRLIVTLRLATYGTLLAKSQDVEANNTVLRKLSSQELELRVSR